MHVTGRQESYVLRALGTNGWARYGVGAEARCPLHDERRQRKTGEVYLCAGYLFTPQLGLQVLVRAYPEGTPLVLLPEAVGAMRCRCPECNGTLEVQFVPTA